VSTRIEVRWDSRVDGGQIEASADEVWYAVVPPAPAIRARFGVGESSGSASRWGSMLWGTARWGDATLEEFAALPGAAPVDSGRRRHTWHLAAAGRYARVRLESTEPAAKLILRSVEIAVRPSNKDR
jgi:hypothetical protein